MVNRSCSGFSATTSWAVEQLGLAMMPLGISFSASALTSGTTSGTCRSMRQALELSITMQPWAAILGAHSLAMAPPALIRHDVGALEVVIVQRLHFQDAVAEGDFACRPSGWRPGPPLR